MIHLLATFSAGICAVGLILLIYRSRGRKPPRYLLPLAAALAMLAYNLWNEYSWASRTIAALPDHIRVVKKFGSPAAWKPWTYVFPQIDRFVAVDTLQIRRNQELPGHVLAEVILVARLDPTVTTQMLFDCRQARRSDVIPSEGFDERGLPKNPRWVAVEPEDPLFRVVCSTR